MKLLFLNSKGFSVLTVVSGRRLLEWLNPEPLNPDPDVIDDVVGFLVPYLTCQTMPFWIAKAAAGISELKVVGSCCDNNWKTAGSI